MSSSFIDSFTSFSWSSVSIIEKFFVYPKSSAWRLSILAKMLWNVPHQIYFERSPTIPSILCRISLAALFVKVMANMDEGATLCFFII